MVLLRHPYLNLEAQSLKRWSVLTGVSFLLCTAIFAAAVPAAHLAAVASFVQTDPATAQGSIEELDAGLRTSFSFMLGFDFLYDLLHNNLVALLAAWGAKRLGLPWVLASAAVLAWVMWLDSALNVVENLAFMQILSTGNVQPWHQPGSAIFHFRTTTLVAGAGIACVFHLWASARGRAA